MVLSVKNNHFHYELQKLCGIFVPDEPITVICDEECNPVENEKLIIAKLNNFASEENGETVEFVLIEVSFYSGKTDENGDFEVITRRKTQRRYSGEVDNLSLSLADSKDSIELITARTVYEVLSEALDKKPRWGILTGIRPSKLLIRLIEENGENEGVEYFKNCFMVEPEKTELALSVAKAENKIMSLSEPDSYSLYVSIPFCPTRCSYCSFVSSAVNKESVKQLIPIYLDKLSEELKLTAEIADKCGIKLKSAYIGGGTPSILDAAQTDELLSTINSCFDMSYCHEFTFEAGRPDTITEEKLEAVFENKVDRISINPQTMSDEVLRVIGRRHSAKEVCEAFEKARKVGFKNINMDLIAGLPSDTTENFSDGINKIVGMSPENVTVHTLAYKRSSDLDYKDGTFNDSFDVENMVSYAYRTLLENGYKPYYMYRQAKSVGNLENTGFSKPGFESFYNIFMMEECHTILACGAGAVTKLKNPYTGDISRIFNFKYPYEYNSRFENLTERKLKIEEFYNKLIENNRRS